MKARILTLGLALSLAGLAHGASFAPVPLTASSFNFHPVVPVDAIPCPYWGVNANVDNGTNSPAGGDGYFEIGCFPNNPTRGVPNSGSVWTNASLGASHKYQMQTFWPSNSTLMLWNKPGWLTGNLAVNDPNNYSGISLVTGGSGSGGFATFVMIVQHADGVNETLTNQVADWFTTSRPATFVNATTGVSTTNQWAWLPNGRINVSPNSTGATTATLDNNGTTSGSHLYSQDLLLTDTTSPVTNINFTWVQGSASAAQFVFCVSGSTDGINYNPMQSVTGWNTRGVAQSVFPTDYDSTMDNGTNVAGNSNGTGNNTWYEKGWLPFAPNTGFPTHGSTINSATTGRPYQMAPNYHLAMSALCDTNHQTLNIGLQSPQSYTAFSLLVSGGNIGGNNVMSNKLIMQHADGSNETNIFNCYDWFNTAQPVAYNAQGRAAFPNGRSVNTVNGGAPKLFESQFILANSQSPVTNILVKYYNPGVGGFYSPAATTFIFAVSATAGGIPLVFNTNTLAQNVYAGGTATFFANVTAAGDINSAAHYHWLYSPTEYGTFTPLADGGAISGSQSASLVVSGVGNANVGYYECFVTNSVSTNISFAAPLTILTSTAANISQPGDTISSFGGTASGAGAPGAVDGTLAEYINFGSGSGTFAGPVGIVTTPTAGNSVITALRFFAASSSPASDPADYLLEGSNDGISFTNVSSGSLALSDVRNENLTDPIDVTDQILQEVDFANAIGYNTYRVTFNNVKTNASATSLQISEVQLLGALSPLPPGIVVQPFGSQKLFVGESFTASVKVNGPSPYYYTWFNGATPVAGQTNATLSLSNIQITDSGSYSCTISNIYGSTNSATVSLTVLATPSGYAGTVLADSPVAYWRLDEGPDNGSGNNGTIANDYVGGHDGIYTNVVLGVAGYSLFDTNTAAGFDTNASYVGSISGINFSNAAASNTGAFSIEAWVLGTNTQAGDAGIVALGYGAGGEQFALDCGGISTGFRLYFRDAIGNAHNAASAITTADGKWHHLVGVVDEANSNEVLYVDGVAAATTPLSTNLGVLNASASAPFTIGARSSSSTSGFVDQFKGSIDEVAVYGHALSAAQVQNHYFSAGIIPTLTTSPTNTTESEGTSATFYSAAYGSPTLSYQWWNSDNTAPTTPLVGETNQTLTFNNLAASLDGTYYQIVVSNSYGAVTSTPALLSVATNAPAIVPGGDLNASYVIYAGNPLVLSVSAAGSQPISYGWSFNGSPLANGDRVTGADSNKLVIANAQVSDSGTYQVFMTNNRGTGQSSIATVTVLPVLTLNGLGNNWSQNGGSGMFNGSNSVKITDGSSSEAHSVFYANPVYVDGFTAGFTYQTTGGADGATFVIQNDPRGAAAVGPAGGGLGYGANSQNSGTSITPSVALEFNIYSGNGLGGVGIDLDTDGLVGNVTIPGSVNIASGNPIGVTLTYLNGSASLTLTDTVAAVSFTTTLPINIPTVIGTNMAYVGFTGGTGGITSTQTITNFTFLSLVSLSVSTTGNNVTFSWPAEVGGYQLQSNPAINNAAGWTTLTNIPSVSGNQNQIVLPASIGAGQYFRLINP